MAALLAVAGVVAFGWAWDRSSQPASGDGWSLLARQRGLAGADEAVTIDDQAGLAAAWKNFRVLGDPPTPTVDLATSAVVWFTTRGTIGCPSRLDGLRFDVERKLVVVMFSRGLTAGCDSAAVPDSFLVVVERGRLPSGPYTFESSGP